MHLTVSNLARKFILLFVIVLPFSHLYAPHRWLPLPLLVLILGAVCVIFFLINSKHIRYYGRCFSLSDLWLVLFLFWLAISLVLTGEIRQKNLNHLAALSTVIIMYYFFVKLLFSISYSLPNAASYHIRFMRYPVLLTFLFVYLEFINANFVDFGLRKVLVYAENIGKYTPLYAGTFYRARGFTSESGNLALFLNTFSPLVIAYFLNKKQYAYMFLFFVSYMAALSFSFSAAGLCFVLLGMTVSLFIYLWDRKVIGISKRAITLIFLICLFLYIAFTMVPDAYILPIKHKLALSETYGAGDRLERWSEAINSIKQNPIIGKGIGSTSAERGTGVVSFYLLLLREGGLFAFILFMCFVMTMFYKIVTMPKKFSYKYAYIVSFVAALGHYAVISDFWLPWIWFLFSIISCDYALLKRAKSIRLRTPVSEPLQ